MNNHHHDTAIFDQERDSIERDDVQRLMALAQAAPIYRTKLPEIPVLELITRKPVHLDPKAWE